MDVSKFRDGRVNFRKSEMAILYKFWSHTMRKDVFGLKMNSKQDSYKDFTIHLHSRVIL